MELERHSAYLADAIAAARAAPLSLRKARLALALLDAYADRLYDAGSTGAEDVLAFRAELAARSPALALVFALAAHGPGAPTLAIDTVEVPLADYSKLGVADFMVSLYNQHTVQRLRVTLPDGTRRDVHEVIAEAMAALEADAR